MTNSRLAKWPIDSVDADSIQPWTWRCNRDGELDTELVLALRSSLLDTGIALVREAPVSVAQTALKSLTAALFPWMARFSTGEHPATETSGIYMPVEYSPKDYLLWHHENSFYSRWPRYIAFMCVRPADRGGETQLVDSRIIYDLAPAGERDNLRETGVLYTRTMDGIGGRSWQQLLRTQSPEEAHRVALASGDLLQIYDDGTAQIMYQRPGIIDVDGDYAWFAQILHWHPRALPAGIRQLTLNRIVPQYRNCLYGSRATISDDLVDWLIRSHLERSFTLHWQQGDVLLFDNRRYSHARRPFAGQRNHLVSLIGSSEF